MKKARGAVAAGHEETVKTAEMILKAGGNAFDAVVAAHLTACMAEPLLSSLGGGGFMLARVPDQKKVLYDFFVHTPQKKSNRQYLDFYPIQADFGVASQEFHIGAGSIATPGTVRGIFAVHKDLCTMPLYRLAEPAVKLGKEGVKVNAFQSYIFDIIQAIYASNPETFRVFQSPSTTNRLPTEGDIVKMPQLADFIENLAREGESLFYEGEVAGAIAGICREGAGHLEMGDLKNYRVVKREPLKTSYRNFNLFTNPPPSSAGSLITFALHILDELDISPKKLGKFEYLELLAEVQKATHQARLNADIDTDSTESLEKLLNPELLHQYRQKISSNTSFSRGTTHISVADKDGNIAALSTSNGEGCGHYIPGTGTMLNNMLGEEDLNSTGFHNWQENRRMTSMMSPGILQDNDGNVTAFGSGGSNRIRTAILQFILNMADFGMTFENSIESPRIHVEPDHLYVEDGFSDSELIPLLEKYRPHTVWEGKNLFFGGVHAVQNQAGVFKAFGDPRRGGSALVVK